MPRIDLCRDHIISMFESKTPYSQIAAALGVSKRTIVNRLQEYGLVPPRPFTAGICSHCKKSFEGPHGRKCCSPECAKAATNSPQAQLKKSLTTKGQKRKPDTHVYIGSLGYRLVVDPRQSTYGRRERFNYEQRVIAERALGRPLKRGEVVHHINGIKTDNRNCNLLICSNSYHRWLHEYMCLKYQQDHFGVAA